MKKFLEIIFTGIIFFTGYLIFILVSKFISTWILAFLVSWIIWFILGFLLSLVFDF